MDTRTYQRETMETRAMRRARKEKKAASLDEPSVTEVKSPEDVLSQQFAHEALLQAIARDLSGDTDEEEEKEEEVLQEGKEPELNTETRSIPCLGYILKLVDLDSASETSLPTYLPRIVTIKQVLDSLMDWSKKNVPRPTHEKCVGECGKEQYGIRLLKLFWEWENLFQLNPNPKQVNLWLIEYARNLDEESEEELRLLHTAKLEFLDIIDPHFPCPYADEEEEVLQEGKEPEPQNDSDSDSDYQPETDLEDEESESESETETAREPILSRRAKGMVAVRDENGLAIGGYCFPK